MYQVRSTSLLPLRNGRAVGRTLTGCTAPAVKEAGMALEVQRIACVNNGGFVMNFGIQYLDLDETIPQPVMFEGLNSGDYPILDTRVIDLIEQGVSEGRLVSPRVNAYWGESEAWVGWLTCAANGQTATFDVSGTTLDVHIKLIGTE
jgi:hypothetical protein